MKVAIFENKELAEIKSKSGAIVEALATNYGTIIGGMVGKSQKTKEQYKRNAATFLAFVQSNGINAHSFGEFRNALEVLQIAESTKNGYLSAGKAFVREAIKYGFLPIDIAANVPLFKTPKGHIKDGLQLNEVQKVVTQIGGIKKEGTRLKMAAFFHLFAIEGFRQMEAAALDVKDVNLADKQIKVRGKGKDGKQAHLMLDETAAALAAWIKFADLKTGYLFPAGKGGNGHISERAIRKFFTCPKYGIFARCGVDGRSVHGFRHFNITATLDAFGGDTRRAQKRARISAVQTILSYDDRRTGKIDANELQLHFSKNLHLPDNEPSNIEL